MGKPKSILIGDKNDAGILIEHVKSLKEIRVSGWYDSGYAGMGTEHYSLEKFCEQLGIKMEKTK